MSIEVKKPATAKASKRSGSTDAVAYMGPTIKGVAVNGTVYTNGIPAELEEKIKEVPAIRGLMIKVTNLASAGVAIQTEGTALNNLYKTVETKLQ